MPQSYERGPAYERVVDGQVVERVQPMSGDYEDTRLGLLALEGTDGWRVAGTEPPDTISPAQYARPGAVAGPPAPTEDPDGSEPDPETEPGPARPARRKR